MKNINKYLPFLAFFSCASLFTVFLVWLARFYLFIYIFICLAHLPDIGPGHCPCTSFLLPSWLPSGGCFPPSAPLVTGFWSCAAHNCIQSSANRTPLNFPSYVCPSTRHSPPSVCPSVRLSACPLAHPLITLCLLSGAANDNKGGLLIRHVVHVESFSCNYSIAAAGACVRRGQVGGAGQRKENSLCKLLGHVVRTWIRPMTSWWEIRKLVEKFRPKFKDFSFLGENFMMRVDK